MTALKSALLLLLVCYCATSEILRVVPGNVNSVASHISPSADIQETVIHFKPGSYGELLLTVPMKAPETAIVITLGIDSTFPNEHDSDPMLRVTDGTNSNSFYIVDAKNYNTAPPCYPVGEERDETRVSAGTKVPSTFKFTIIPWERYGYCETAQEGGYINVGLFPQQLSPSKHVYFQLFRNNGEEQYFIHYISIESM